MKTTQQFNEDLEARLRTAGFTMDEVILAALSAELKTCMGLIGRVSSRQEALTLAAVMASTATGLVEFAAEKGKLDTGRIITAAKIISTACAARTVEIEQEHGAREVTQMIYLDSNPATDPKDIN